MSKREGDPGYAADWCIHYRSSRLGEVTTCEAGVPYESVKTEGMNRQPCFASSHKNKNCLPCDKCRLPTPEEVSAHEKWCESRFDKLRIVMVGIDPWRKTHKKTNFSEVVECPACKGKLRLSTNAYNSHVHGHCETKGCVSWME